MSGKILERKAWKIEPLRSRLNARAIGEGSEPYTYEACVKGYRNVRKEARQIFLRTTIDRNVE